MMKTRRLQIGAMLIGVSGLLLAACGSSSTTSSSSGSANNKTPYVVGFSDGLSGAIAAYAQPELNDARAVFNMVNAEGGINGHPIQLDALDQGNPGSGKAPANVNQLAQQDHASVIFGMAISNDCESAMPVAAQDQVPLLCQHADTSQVIPPRKYLFVDTDIESAEVGSELTMLHKMLPGVAHPRIVIFGNQNLGTEQWGTALKAAAQKDGVTVLSEPFMSETATSAAPQISQIVSEHPDAVISELFGQFYPPLLTGLKNAGLDIPVIANSAGVFYSSFSSAYPKLAAAFIGAPLEAGQYHNSSTVQALQTQMKKLGMTTTAAMNQGENSLNLIAPFAIVNALKTCGFPCSGPKMADALNHVSLNIPGLFPNNYKYSASDHTGATGYVYYQLNPSTNQLAPVSGVLPASKI